MTGSSQRFSCQVVFHDPVASLESTLHCHIKHKRILHMFSYIFCVVNVECSTVQRNGNLFAPMLWYIYFAFTHHTRTWHTSLRLPEYLRITACSPYKCFFCSWGIYRQPGLTDWLWNKYKWWKKYLTC